MDKQDGFGNAWGFGKLDAQQQQHVAGVDHPSLYSVRAGTPTAAMPAEEQPGYIAGVVGQQVLAVVEQSSVGKR